MIRDVLWSVVVVSVAAIAFLVGREQTDRKIHLVGTDAPTSASSSVPHQRAAIAAFAEVARGAAWGLSSPPQGGPVVREALAGALVDRADRHASSPPSAAPPARAAKPARVVDGKSTSAATSSPSQEVEPVVREALADAPADRAERQVPASLPRSAAPPARAANPGRVLDGQNVSAATVRSLQGQLRRLGCYGGPIDGDWGPASRYAAARFVKAVNAALPTKEPDDVLLVLSRETDGRVCKDAGGVVTAALGPAWHATVRRADVAAAQASSVEERVPGPTKARIVRHAMDVPRVVRADGRPSVVQDPAVSLSAAGRVGDARSMALGVVRPAQTPSVASVEPVTGGRSASFETHGARVRIEPRADQRVRPERRRASRMRWSRRIFQALDLDGS